MNFAWIGFQSGLKWFNLILLLFFLVLLLSLIQVFVVVKACLYLKLTVPMVDGDVFDDNTDGFSFYDSLW